MPNKQVTGSLSPDATVAHTGEPAGMHGGAMYWEYTGADGQTWKIFKSIGFGLWMINRQFVDDFSMFGNPTAPGWYGPATVDGVYSPFQFATGNATVADAPLSAGGPFPHFIRRSQFMSGGFAAC